jgi:tetratricopeptide (TPR) repeat protein
MKTKKLLILLLILVYACSNETAMIEETEKNFYTYTFSDPDLVPRPDRNYYPYFRFDGYSQDSIAVEWKVIEMENAYVKVHIMPEIGGKVWGAIEKSTGNEFIYYNSVVKFRDIAMRGPWTSGGIEFNFGVIGHSPHVSTPVDYKIRNNDDGSVSCFIGGIELFTRTRWETEINLQPDKAYFTTNTKWNNVTPLMQPYYNWSNAAYQAEGDLEFVFPGNTRISHGGSADSWPINQEGRNMSFYNENDFEGDKSNHIMGALNGFYGAYWHDLNFGSGHYARYGDKLGGKIFLWSLSRQGGIWEDLLTDTDGQYVELQAGRLFNQPGSNSTQTPFKHFGFLPHAYDEFKEYWYPVMNIGGMLQSNSFGALNIMENNTEQEIYFSPLQPIKDEIKIYFGDELKYTFNVNLKPLEVWKTSINTNQSNEPVKIIVGTDKKLIYTEKDQISSRPTKIPDSFNWNSVYGLYTAGINWIYQGRFERAYEKLTACLELDSLYAPALNHLAELQLRKNDLESAMKNVKKSLSMNTYDPKANFVFGLISKQMNHLIDAQDGFAVASITPEYREAANLELAKLFIQKNELLTAREYVEKVLAKEGSSQDAILLMSIISRRNGEKKEADKYINQLETISLLNHFARAERLFLNPGKQTSESFTSLIKNELPYQTFMEMALWYEYLGAVEDAIKILELSPENALIHLQLAYLYQNINDVEKSESSFERFIQSTTDFVFPFRKELIPALEWAIRKTENWKPKYYLGLLHWSLGNKTLAKDFFNACGDSPESPYFYLAKTDLLRDEKDYDPEQDLLKARKLGMDDWRTSLAVIEYYLRDGLVEKALSLSKESLEMFPANDALKYNHAKCLLANGLYAESLNELENTTILPFEGARYGRVTYRQAAVMESIQLFEKQKFEEAIETIKKARLWPENLGVGRPYDVDERIEDFLEAENLLRLNKTDKAHELYERIITYSHENEGRYSSTDFLYLISLKRLNRDEQANSFLARWQNEKPGDPLFKWSKAMLNNNRNTGKLIEEQINTEAGGTPWDPRYADTEFELIKEIFAHIDSNSNIVWK